MLQSHRLWVLEMLEGCLNIAGQRQVNGAVFIIPFEGNATVPLTFPIFHHRVSVFEGLGEVLSIGFVNVLDAKIVNNQTKRQGP